MTTSPNTPSTASASYRAGRAWASLPQPVRVLLVVALILGVIFVLQRPTDHALPPSPAVGSLPSNEAQSLISKCNASVDAKRAEYSTAIQAGQYWEAATLLRQCADVLKRPDLQQLVADAEIRSHLAEINNPKTSREYRARAMTMLVRDYPTVGRPYAAESARLNAKLERDEATALARRRKAEGVSIGMTPEAVRASSWGNPTRINRTTRATGTSEQWVYHSRAYLYFENDVLTAIQH